MNGPLFMMIPEDKEIHELESKEDYGYWEEGVDDATLSTLMDGSMTDKSCYHCG